MHPNFPKNAITSVSVLIAVTLGSPSVLAAPAVNGTSTSTITTTNTTPTTSELQILEQFVRGKPGHYTLDTEGAIKAGVSPEVAQLLAKAIATNQRAGGSKAAAPGGIQPLSCAAYSWNGYSGDGNCTGSTTNLCVTYAALGFLIFKVPYGVSFAYGLGGWFACTL
jgi:hypothetical protein